MADVPIPPRLRALLGATAAGLTETSLRGLIGLPEADDLEVKSEIYGKSDSDRREFAADVAAFANARGGVLLIGAKETADVVTSLDPISEPNGEVLRLKQIIAGAITPYLETEIAVIEADADPDLGYVVVVVPRSPAAPHAVAVNADLRFVVRDGPRKRPIGEAEVSTRYRQRFNDARSRADRLDEMHTTVVESQLGKGKAWLVISLVPDFDGTLPLARGSIKEFRDWLPAVARELPLHSPTRDTDARYTVGIQRLIAIDSAGLQHGVPNYLSIELHSDGSGTVAVPVGEQWRGTFADDLPASSLTIDDEGLAITVVGSLCLLAKHAERTGASGSASVRSSIRAIPTNDGIGFEMGLGFTRHHGIPQQLPGSRLVDRVTGPGHTLPIDSMTSPGPELIAASYLVFADLLAGFGIPAPHQFDENGTVFMPYFGAYASRPFRAWCESHGIDVSDEQHS